MSKQTQAGGFNAIMLLLVACMFYISWQSMKQDFPKERFTKDTGKVTGVSNKHERLPNRDETKYRYISINNGSKTFEVFVGKDAGDFRPQYENIASLKRGDSITIYHDNDYSSAYLVRPVYFIYRGEEPVFIQGNSKKVLEYVVIGFIVVVMIFFVYLRKKGRIS